MHTAHHQTDTQAAEAPRAEAALWADVAGRWRESDHPTLWSDLPGREADVVGLYDPKGDIDRRSGDWAYIPGSYDLADVARFAAGLARAEADAWVDDRGHVATRAYADRRFLLSDRFVHWVVPWLTAVRRCYPDLRAKADESLALILTTGDRLRLAPALAGSEGLVVPGFDSFGPLDSGVSLTKTLPSLWSGEVLSTHDLAALRHAAMDGRRLPMSWLKSSDTRQGLGTLYREAATRWDELAAAHPGTAQLWRDLAHRARRTAAMLNH